MQRFNLNYKTDCSSLFSKMVIITVPLNTVTDLPLILLKVKLGNLKSDTSIRPDLLFNRFCGDTTRLHFIPTYVKIHFLVQ